MARPDLSVCLVNWNTRADLEQAITSLLADADHWLRRAGSVVEVIVVDNASTDGSAEMVRTRFPAVALVEAAENLGFARGYNLAASRAAGRHLLMLNPDTVVRPGALSALVEFLDSHPRAGAAGPRLVNPDGSLQYSCRRFPRPMAALFRNTPLGRLLPGNRFTRDYLMAEWDHDTPRQVDWLSGAALCIRREAWEQVGGFDEAFFMYAEDIDWCLRAHQAGWEVWYVPHAVVVHRIGASSDQRPLAMVREFHRSMALFYRKHYARKWPWGLRWLPMVGIRVRGGVVALETRWRLWLARWRGRRRAR